MKNKLALTTLLILFWSSIKAQNISVSDDNNKISFIITDNTTKSDIQKADSIFAAHGISTNLKASWKKGRVSKLDISVTCAQGSVKYHTAKFDSLKKGVTILVNKTPDATVALAVGPTTEE